ncbi:DUF1016 domain-containing protein [Ilyomonas limi]|uniref:DUF1016 domain-containing protein n=2 Tax=Ilyomonas limi TaxID=2575867 RepID=A0A4U3L6Z9_9BACT|nr:DUF1016 domain-containing protein [Ilyomonas limi]
MRNFSISSMNPDYKQWLAHLKAQIRSAQIKAALKVNAELILLYWQLGNEIVQKQNEAKWGDKWLHQLSKDLMSEFPDIKGCSHTNLKYIIRWYQFYAPAIGQQAVAQLQNKVKTGGNTTVQQPVGQIGQQVVDQIPALLTTIPWGHHLQIITKCKKLEEALFYIKETSTHNWSRAVLVHQIESGLYHRKGTAVTNFETTLPKPQSDLAKELLKDPYTFDFLSLSEEYKERDLENALTDHITKFLLELGAGFSFVGRQYHITVGGDDFYIDLLFYHLKLRCFVVIELKTGKFIPEYAGKLNFYLNIIDDSLKHATDQPSIGIIICKERNKVVAEYALRGMDKPIGVSEYQLTEKLPAALKGKLPTVEQIEEELKDITE